MVTGGDGVSAKFSLLFAGDAESWCGMSCMESALCRRSLASRSRFSRICLRASNASRSLASRMCALKFASGSCWFRGIELYYLGSLDVVGVLPS